LDSSKTKAWNELVELFVDQFIFNTMIDVTLRDLETTKKGVGQTFSEGGRERHLRWLIGQMRKIKST